MTSPIDTAPIFTLDANVSYEELLLRKNALIRFQDALRVRLKTEVHGTGGFTSLRNQYNRASKIIARINSLLPAKKEEQKKANIEENNKAQMTFYGAYYRTAKARLSSDLHESLMRDAKELCGKTWNEA